MFPGRTSDALYDISGKIFFGTLPTSLLSRTGKKSGCRQSAEGID